MTQWADGPLMEQAAWATVREEVGGGRQANLGARTRAVVGVDASQPRSRGAIVITAAVALRVRFEVRQIGQDVDLIPQPLDRLQIGRKREVLAGPTRDVAQGADVGEQDDVADDDGSDPAPEAAAVDDGAAEDRVGDDHREAEPDGRDGAERPPPRHRHGFVLELGLEPMVFSDLQVLRGGHDVVLPIG